MCVPNLVNRTIFDSVKALWKICIYKWSKMSFSWITPKILTFEYYAKNKTYSEVILYVCTKFGQNWLRNTRQKSKMAATKFIFLTFQYLTAVISRASSWSPCYIFFYFVHCYICIILWEKDMTIPGQVNFWQRFRTIEDW